MHLPDIIAPCFIACEESEASGDTVVAKSSRGGNSS